ncbi:MAG: glycosyltransferase family 2 protein, partial [Acidimicrobiia bacterium]
MDLERYSDPNLVLSRLSESPSKDFSIVTFTAGWPGDLERLHASLRAFCGEPSWELIAVSNNSPDVDEFVQRIVKADGEDGEDGEVRGISFSQNVGYGGGVNSGIVQSAGKVIVVVDTSVEATGDFLTPIAETLKDSSIGLVGKWGLLSPDLRHFDEATYGEVDAMQAYLMAFRREDSDSVGRFDPKFKFYRNADIDYSMRWRDRGFKVVALDLPITRHEHREWESLSPEQREAKSRDNFARLLRNWRDRTDLLTGRAQSHK